MFFPLLYYFLTGFYKLLGIFKSYPEKVVLKYRNHYKASKFDLIMDEEEEKMVRAVIAGASEALKYREKHPKALDDEIIKFVSLNAKKIAKNVD